MIQTKTIYFDIGDIPRAIVIDSLSNDEHYIEGEDVKTLYNLLNSYKKKEKL